LWRRRRSAGQRLGARGPPGVLPGTPGLEDRSPLITGRLILALSVLMMGAGAPSSHILVGTARPAISPEQVRIYSHAPPAFEEVAILSASSNSVFGPGGQRAMDKVIERLKAQAAQLGANGI